MHICTCKTADESGTLSLCDETVCPSLSLGTRVQGLHLFFILRGDLAESWPLSFLALVKSLSLLSLISFARARAL